MDGRRQQMRRWRTRHAQRTFTIGFLAFLTVRLSCACTCFIWQSSEKWCDSDRYYKMALVTIKVDLAATPAYHNCNPPPFCLASRKPLWRESEPVDINSQWRESWKSASVVNAHLVDDPTIWQPGFALLRQHWSFLNRFRTGQGHCGACKKKRETFRLRSVFLRWDPNDVTHCRILPTDKTTWWLV